MIWNCPTCGKAFDVLYPELWAYKRGFKGHGLQYMCSWKCLRSIDNKKGEFVKMKNSKLTREQKMEAVRIAISGGDPLAFLAECGSLSPAAIWYSIKQSLKDSDPETYEKIPKRILHKESRREPETPEVHTVQEAADIVKNFFKAEIPEEQKITQPVVYDSMTVREVEGNFGRYRRSDVGQATYIDFEVNDGADTLSYTIDQWRSLRKEQERAAMILGVEL